MLLPLPLLLPLYAIIIIVATAIDSVVATTANIDSVRATTIIDVATTATDTAHTHTDTASTTDIAFVTKLPLLILPLL